MIIDRRERVNRKAQQWAAREKYRKNWHPWFAWYPVDLEWGDGRWVWLQRIERKRYESTHDYENGGPFGGPVSITVSGWNYRLTDNEG